MSTSRNESKETIEEDKTLQGFLAVWAEKPEKIMAAAEKGDAMELTNLGACYEDGIGVEKNAKKAVEYYQQAAEKGYPVALFNLGNLYSMGIGVEKDAKKAVEYYRQAAKKGYTRALVNLGVCYKCGIGVEEDTKKAAAYWMSCFLRTASNDEANAVAKKYLLTLYQSHKEPEIGHACYLAGLLDLSQFSKLFAEHAKTILAEWTENIQHEEIKAQCCEKMTAFIESNDNTFFNFNRIKTPEIDRIKIILHQKTGRKFGDIQDINLDVSSCDAEEKFSAGMAYYDHSLRGDKFSAMLRQKALDTLISASQSGSRDAFQMLVNIVLTKGIVNEQTLKTNQWLDLLKKTDNKEAAKIMKLMLDGKLKNPYQDNKAKVSELGLFESKQQEEEVKEKEKIREKIDDFLSVTGNGIYQMYRSFSHMIATGEAKEGSVTSDLDREIRNTLYPLDHAITRIADLSSEIDVEFLKSLSVIIKDAQSELTDMMKENVKFKSLWKEKKAWPEHLQIILGSLEEMQIFLDTNLDAVESEEKRADSLKIGRKS